MGKQKGVSHNKELKFLYELLPRYYEQEEPPEIYLNRLQKAIYYNTGKGRTIEERLKDVGFSVGKYPHKQQFVFYLTYIELTHTNRSFIRHAHKKEQQGHSPNKKKQKGPNRPNEKFVSNLMKSDADSDFRGIGTQFLIAYDQYKRLETETASEKEFVERYNEFLIYMHHQLKETWKAKGHHADDERLAKEARAFRLAGRLSESAHRNRYEGEQSYLKERLEKLHVMESQESAIAETQRQLKEYMRHPIIELIEQEFDSFLYSFVFQIRYFLAASECLLRRAYQNPSDSGEMERSFSMVAEEEFARMKIFARGFPKMLRTNILLDFGARLFFQQEKAELQCELDILDGLCSEAQGEEKRIGYETDPVILDDAKLEGMATKDLLALMLPDKSQRKAGDRNTIAARMRNVMKVLEFLRRKQGIIVDVRNSNQVRSMYEELYLYNTYRYKNRAYTGIVTSVISGKASFGEALLLKEKQIRGTFRKGSLWKEYSSYVKERRIFIEKILELYDSFEDSMNG